MESDRPDALDNILEAITAKAIADPEWGRKLLERNAQYMIDHPCKVKFEAVACTNPILDKCPTWDNHHSFGK